TDCCPATMAETFPVKPKLRPTSDGTGETAKPEAKYWRSFRKPKDVEAIASESFLYPISSVSFSPVVPHDFAAAHSATVTLFSGKTLEAKSKITDLSGSAASAAFRCDGKLLAVGDSTGAVHVFEAKSRSHLRRLRGHAAAARLVCYPRAADKLHLLSGGDDSVVKYWDVTTETCLFDLLGHKDYVRCGDSSPVSDEMFVSGSYDHRIKLWDVRVSSSGSVMELKHGLPVESVIYLPSGGLIASSGGNVVKIWDVIGGGKLLHTMESHNKTVTDLCMGKVGYGTSEDAEQCRILSVSLDGYMKVFDFSKFKITYSMRFPQPLLSVGFSPDCSTRVIGTSKGNLYIGRRKKKLETVDEGGYSEWGAPLADEHQRKVLRPTHFRYFTRGQSRRPAERDYLVKRPKKVKFAKHDKLFKKFRHKEAFVAALTSGDSGKVVAVMEELVARKKLLSCVSNLEGSELNLLVEFLQKNATRPIYAGLLMNLALKVIEFRVKDIRSDQQLREHLRNLKQAVEEETRIQQSLLEIQGIVSPILKIAAKRS
ncbi:hypothetical protein M569_06434, partial [Genlisea aurea]